MDKVRVIIAKEWAEVFKNRIVLFSVAFLPLIFIALPLVTVGLTGDMESAAESGGSSDLPEYMQAICEGLSEGECVQVYMIDLFTLMFMILPVMIPVTIAAYSIVGEKTTRSLEPLLATPITTGELVLGKLMAAALPAVGATWLGYAIYVVSMQFLVHGVVAQRLLEPLWLLAIFVLGPLLTILSVCVAIMVSSRVSDPRVAEQLAGIVVLPVILFLVGQSVGFLILDQQLVVVAAIIVALLDGVLTYLAVKIFQREVILTSWK